MFFNIFWRLDVYQKHLTKKKLVPHGVYRCLEGEHCSVTRVIIFNNVNRHSYICSTLVVIYFFIGCLYTLKLERHYLLTSVLVSTISFPNKNLSCSTACMFSKSYSNLVLSACT